MEHLEVQYLLYWVMSRVKVEQCDLCFSEESVSNGCMSSGVEFKSELGGQSA